MFWYQLEIWIFHWPLINRSRQILYYLYRFACTTLCKLSTLIGACYSITWHNAKSILILWFLYSFFCSFELGSGPARIRSPIKINDGYAHIIQVTRLGRQGSLTIDNNLSYSTSGQSQGPLQSLNTAGNVYLGKKHQYFTFKIQSS